MSETGRSALRDTSKKEQEADPGGFACQMVAAVGLLFFLALITGRIAGADAGSYADWVAAFATLAAFAAAVVAAWFAARAFGKEVQRDTARQQAERRSQAALVAAWPGPVIVTPPFTDAGPLQPREITQVTATIRNASPVPVTDVKLRVVVTNYADDAVVISTPILEIQIPVVPPDRRAEVITMDLPEPISINELSTDRDGLDSQVALQVRLRATLTFTDAGNVRWYRNDLGFLGEVV